MKGKKDEAIADMNEKCRPLLAQLVKASDDCAEFSLGVAAKQSTASNEQYAERRNLLIGASAFAVLLAAAAAYLVTRSITVPVEKALQVAEAVAAGDLTQHIESEGKDEVWCWPAR